MQKQQIIKLKILQVVLCSNKQKENLKRKANKNFDQTMKKKKKIEADDDVVVVKKYLSS